MSSFVEENDLDALEAADQARIAEEAAEQREPAPEPDEEPAAPGGELVPVTAAVADLVPEHLGGAELSIIPPETEMRALVQLAVTLSAAELVPRALRDKPNDTLLVLLTARDLGIKLTTALRLCHPIEGQVTVAPKLKLAIIRERKVARVWPDPSNNGETATWYARRADDPDTLFSSTFTWEDAQRGGMVLWACEGPSGHTDACKENQGKSSRDAGPRCKQNYWQWPARMLSWRALGYLMDDACGEVGAGLYSPDELGAITDEDGTLVLDVAEVGPLEGTAEPRSMANERRRKEAAANDPREQPAEEADRDLLARMMRALPEAGTEAGIALWPQAVGVKIADLTVGKVKTARALIDSLWKRAEAGEWGEWDRPFDPDAPLATPDGSEPRKGVESPAATEGASEGREAQEGAQGPASGDAGGAAAGEETIDSIIDRVGAMPIADVAAELDRLEEEPEGVEERDLRRALAVRLGRDAGLL